MDNKRDKIIFHASKRFQYYGVSKTTMQEIATDADVAVGTLYLYFKNKDELIVASAQKFGEEHKNNIKEVMSLNISASEKLKKYITDRYKRSEETRTIPYAVEIVKKLLKVYPERLDEESNWMYETILSILKEGINNKEFKIDFPEKDTEVFLYSIAIFFPLATYERTTWVEESRLCSVIDWFIDKWKTN